MKAILVLDIPENTQIKDFRLDDIAIYHRPTQQGYKLQGELKPMPEEKNVTQAEWRKGYYEFSTKDYVQGWNECIDEILGE